LLTLFLQIVGDIAAVLPPYTLCFLQENEERVGHRQELFGKHITFIPLDRNKLVFPDVSELNDITLLSKNVRNGDHLVGDLGSNIVNKEHESEQQTFSGKSEVLTIKCLLTMTLNVTMPRMIRCGPMQKYVY
jgi:hypothetical protein